MTTAHPSNPPAQLPKLGVIFIGRRRPGFDMDWGRAMEERVRAGLRTERDFTWFEELCHQGMPHHVALFRGQHEAFLRRFAGVIGAQFV